MLHSILWVYSKQNTNIFEGPEVSEKVIPPKKPPFKVVPRKEPPAKGISWHNDTHTTVFSCSLVALQVCVLLGGFLLCLVLDECQNN